MGDVVNLDEERADRQAKQDRRMSDEIRGIIDRAGGPAEVTKLLRAMGRAPEPAKQTSVSVADLLKPYRERTDAMKALRGDLAKLAADLGCIRKAAGMSEPCAAERSTQVAIDKIDRWLAQPEPLPWTLIPVDGQGAA